MFIKKKIENVLDYGKKKVITRKVIGICQTDAEDWLILHIFKGIRTIFSFGLMSL